MQRYFDPRSPDKQAESETVALMVRSGRSDPRAVRRLLQSRGIESGIFVRYAYRPSDDRERGPLGRDLTPDEARYVTEMVRRIAAIILLHPQLDVSYAAVKAATYAWPRRT